VLVAGEKKFLHFFFFPFFLLVPSCYFGGRMHKKRWNAVLFVFLMFFHVIDSEIACDFEIFHSKQDSSIIGASESENTGSKENLVISTSPYYSK
jgi:hypothetical protein